MKEFKIEVEGIKYLVKCDDSKVFSITLRDTVIFVIQRIDKHNIFYRWENETGHHSRLIENLGSAIEEQILIQQF
jgi:hypothetical protein